MKKNQNNSNRQNSSKAKGNTTNGFIPNSLKFISSCIKTVSTNVRSAGASVAGSISGDYSEFQKDQVLWACFDNLELGPSIKRVLLLGYSNGFQVLDVEDASNVSELVSRRGGPVTFLQLQPIPVKSEGQEGFINSHPLLLVVACEEIRTSGSMQNGRDGLLRDGHVESQTGNCINPPTAVRFYSLRSHNYVHVLRFRSAIYMVRCSPRIVAVGLAAQIYCFDALTLENKFSVLTYPVPQLGSQSITGVNIGYGPMAVGPRWLAYASNNPLSSNTGRLSPQSLSPSPGVSPSTSPGNGNLVARYAMESSKQLATGLINLGDMGYKTFSKYYHELLPDGSSSPVSSNSSWKVGRVAGHAIETETAGMVVIKDCVSRVVISQFRAHTSPISALCFDPSGTLLVTASIHGNNINIFRIMPTCVQNGSGTQSYDWGSSHVHLYKLHRGMTSAVIQDICFSHYSQWVAIVSSRGPCHIFVLSPFGGETGLQMQNSHGDGPTLTPMLSLPWWFASSLMINQQSFAAPLPATLSVVCRIRIGNSGWLNTVSNAASSAAGKLSMPSGAVAAAFYSSLRRDVQLGFSSYNPLEHLLVYTPSGNVVQYELLPSVVGEQGESAAKTTGSLVQMQDEELKVKGEAVQWWDVCRREDWPEREENIYGFTLGGQEAAGTVMDSSDFEDDDIGEKDLGKPHERPHFYLSNAEVQVRTGRIPIWQKSKIYFFSMKYPEDEELITKVHAGGEIEIEKIPVHEVEIRRKDLLPVFDHFHKFQSNWSDDRGIVEGKYSTMPPYSHGGTSDRSASFPNASGFKQKFLGDTVEFPAELVSPGAVESPDIGSLRYLDQMAAVKYYPRSGFTANADDGPKSGSAVLASAAINLRSFNSGDISMSPELYATSASSIDESYVVNKPSTLQSSSISPGGTIVREVQSSNSVVTSEASNTGSNRSDLSMNIIDEGPAHEDMQDQLDFGQYFQEEYCKASARDECCETAVVTEADDSRTLHNKEKSEEDGDNDGMLGGVFAFSEEG